MKLERILLAAMIGFAVALGGCAPEEGDACEMPDECGDLICAEVVVCAADAEKCPGTCSSPCETDVDCAEDQYCGDTAGGMRVCLFSRSLGRP